MKSQTHTSRIISYLEELEKTGFTIKPVDPGNCTSILPEFGRWQDVQRLFGIKRGLLYLLSAEGKIKSVSLRRNGNQKGCRLFYLQSVSEYLHRLLAEQGEQILKYPAITVAISKASNVAGPLPPGSKHREQIHRTSQIQAPIINANSSPVSALEQQRSQSNESSFINEKQLLARLSISRRTLFSWRTKGKIPSVRMGGRRVLFHWPSVEAALLRHQRGGER